MFVTRWHAAFQRKQQFSKCTMLPFIWVPLALCCRQKRWDYLISKHPEIGSWSAPGSSIALLQAIAQLCISKVAAWQQKVEGMMHEYAQAKWVQSRIGDTSRSEHQKLRKELLKLSKRMAEALETLVQWQQQQARYMQYLPVAADAGGLYERCKLACDARVACW